MPRKKIIIKIKNSFGMKLVAKNTTQWSVHRAHCVHHPFKMFHGSRCVDVHFALTTLSLGVLFVAEQVAEVAGVHGQQLTNDFVNCRDRILGAQNPKIF